MRGGWNAPPAATPLPLALRPGRSSALLLRRRRIGAAQRGGEGVWGPPRGRRRAGRGRARKAPRLTKQRNRQRNERNVCVCVGENKRLTLVVWTWPGPQWRPGTAGGAAFIELMLRCAPLASAGWGEGRAVAPAERAKKKRDRCTATCSHRPPTAFVSFNSKRRHCLPILLLLRGRKKEKIKFHNGVSGV